MTVPLRTVGVGWRGLLNGQNPLSVTKVFCRQSLKGDGKTKLAID